MQSKDMGNDDIMNGCFVGIKVFCKVKEGIVQFKFY